MQFLNQIVCGDCVYTMSRIDDKSIDLTITSPPYDGLRKYNGYSFDFECVAQELYRITKQGGVVVWVVGDATVKGDETGTSFRQALYFKSLGFRLHDTMIYKKLNPPPIQHNRYEGSFEYMFVFSKGKPRTFNPIMIPCKLAGVVLGGQLRNGGKDHYSPKKRQPAATHKKRENIWEYNPKRNDRTGHPAVFPEQLAHDHILSWSNENDIILDPFCGSGTTCKMAMLLNRNYIGIDISPEYCQLAEQRIAQYERTV
jgi:DNA modification methylase